MPTESTLTKMGLAVAVDDEFWYAVPLKQNLGESWKKTQCLWMYPAPECTGLVHPTAGANVKWFTLKHGESSPVESHARFGIVTFFGMHHPDATPLDAKYIWALPNADDAQMQLLYNDIVAKEAAERASVGEAETTPEPEAPALAASAALASTSAPVADIETPSHVAPSCTVETLSKQHVVKSRNGAYFAVMQRVVGSAEASGEVVGVALQLLDISTIVGGALCLFAKSDTQEQVQLFGDSCSNPVEWESTWPLPEGRSVSVLACLPLQAARMPRKRGRGDAPSSAASQPARVPKVRPQAEKSQSTSKKTKKSEDDIMSELCEAVRCARDMQQSIQSSIGSHQPQQSP